MNQDIKKDLGTLRQSYTFAELDESTIEKNPFKQFELWFNDAQSFGIYEPNAMSLATVSKANEPSLRVVLLKEFSSEGFVFYTNYSSKKGSDLDNNNHVALNFFWPEMQRQIRIEGTVEKVANEKSIEYFYSRPRESQIGAFISEQSHIIESRTVIENKYKEVEANYQDKAIPKPENWGGYLVKPHKIEFWQGRVSRLHDRLVFELKDNNWNLYRLSP